MSAKGARQPVRERLLDGKFQVISRSGLNRCEVALIEALARQADPERKDQHVLTVGNRTGVLGQVACDLCNGNATLHSFDIHHHRLMGDHVVAGFRNRIQRVCEADLPADESYDWGLFQLNRGNFSTELVYDLVQQTAQRLKPGGQLMFAIEGTPLWLVKRLKNYFRNVQVEMPNRNVALVLANQQKELPKEKSFQAEVEVTLPDNISFPMLTFPGVFAHRRCDDGGLALAESTDVVDGDRVIDMGCGAGLIGIALSRLARLQELTLVDSHARAIKATRLNVERNQLESLAQVIQSDGAEADFSEHRERYSLFVGNPPYYSQNQVTQRFVELSHEVLAPGGRVALVTRNPEWLAQELVRYFGEVQYFTRRNYTILRAQKNG